MPRDGKRLRDNMETLVLCLGSNLGDREQNLQTALQKLEEVFGKPLKLSRIMETEALGFNGGDFLNCVAMYSCGLEPLEVLGECKKIERLMGRKDCVEFAPDGRRIYHDRIIDIDILTYGSLSVSTDELTIPHPQIKTRPYVALLLEDLKTEKSHRPL